MKLSPLDRSRIVLAAIGLAAILAMLMTTVADFQILIAAVRADAGGEQARPVAQGGFGSRQGASLLAPGSRLEAASGLAPGVRAELAAAGLGGGSAATTALVGAYVGRYARQLAYTFSAAIPASLTVAALAYLLVFLTWSLQAAGRPRLARLPALPFDLLPYILWVLPLATLARSIYGAQPESEGLLYDLAASAAWRGVAGWLYQFILYVGFAMFLMIFFFNQNERKLKDLHTVIEAERLMGVGAVALFYVMFVKIFARSLFLRQFLFCTMFVFLMDFSFMSLKDINQAYTTPTVFAQGARYFEKAAWAEATLRNSDCPSYVAALGRVRDALPVDAGAAHLIERVLGNPALALDRTVRADLAEGVCRAGPVLGGAGLLLPEHCLPAARDRCDSDGGVTLPLFSTPHYDAIFFEGLHDFYVGLSLVVVFALVLATFAFMDYRGIVDEA